MKLRNKKTGDVIDFVVYKTKKQPLTEGIDYQGQFNSLAELNEEWEDVLEEPSKTIWQIKDSGELQDFEEDDFSDGYMESSKSIGNYFETKEESEQAVEKLKAWKRLEKCNFRFEGYDDRDRGTCGDILIFAHVYTNGNLIDEAQPVILKDLDLLFGGEK